MNTEKDNLKTKHGALDKLWELYLKIILFFVSILIFIALAVTFIYLAVNAYDTALVIAVGASSTIFGLVIFHITKSLFKSK